MSTAFVLQAAKGKLSARSKYNAERLGQWLKEHEGSLLKLVPVSGKVSEEARGYYFGAVIPFLKKIVTEWDSVTGDEVHEILKKNFNGFEAFNPKTGRVERYGRSIAVEDSRKFQEYLLRLADWVMTNYQQTLPDPEEYKEWRDSAPLRGEEESRP